MKISEIGYRSRSVWVCIEFHGNFFGHDELTDSLNNQKIDFSLLADSFTVGLGKLAVTSMWSTRVNLHKG